MPEIMHRILLNKKWFNTYSRLTCTWNIANIAKQQTIWKGAIIIINHLNKRIPSSKKKKDNEVGVHLIKYCWAPDSVALSCRGYFWTSLCTQRWISWTFMNTENKLTFLPCTSITLLLCFSHLSLVVLIYH